MRSRAATVRELRGSLTRTGVLRSVCACEKARPNVRILSSAVGAPRPSPARSITWVSDAKSVPGPGAKLEIQMLQDRVLVRLAAEEGERRSSGGIVIPATAQVARRL